MSVTSEDQEADDIVRFPTDPDPDPDPDPDSRSDNHNHDHASSSSHSSGAHSHCSNSEDEDGGGRQDEEYNSSDYDDDDEEGLEGETGLPPPASFSQHAFAPPFYGRPPTPLPPSPSLTSLLRPSRPTTPDASDDEGHSTTGGGGGGGPPHATTSRAHSGSDPVPRASPKVPTYEYYGFVLYLFSGLSFLIYLLWSYLPSPFLHALGIYYYPNRWWSVAIPSFLVMALVYIYVALALYNTEYLTLRLESVETVVDQAANVAVIDAKGRIRRGKHGHHGHGHGEGGKEKEKGKRGGKGGSKERERERERKTAAEKERERERRREVMLPNGSLNWREVWNEGTDAVMDVPLGGVCEVLYGEDRDGGYLSEDSLDEDEIITRL